MATYRSRGVSLALLVAFVLSAGIAVSDEDKAPRIVIEQMRYDMGEVYEQKVYKHKFKVKNTGNADLRIEKVKPG